MCISINTPLIIVGVLTLCADDVLQTVATLHEPPRDDLGPANVDNLHLHWQSNLFSANTTRRRKDDVTRRKQLRQVALRQIARTTLIARTMDVYSDPPRHNI